MTRAELNQFIEESGFEYQCKVKGKKRHKRYFSRNPKWAYAKYIVVNYEDNSIYGWISYAWPNERNEVCFRDIYCHKLSSEQLKLIFNMYFK